MSMEVKKEFDDIIQEKGNKSVELKKISWYGREPGYDIRWYSHAGEEPRPSKGITGLTEEGLTNLCKVIISNELCDIDEVHKAINEVKNKNNKVLEMSTVEESEVDEDVEDTASDEKVVNMYK